jgi:O-antigen/teichoic acid export membrane protein
MGINILLKKGWDKEKLNCIFTFEIILSILFFIIVYFFAPFIMKLLGKPELTKFVQLFSCVFFYNPFQNPEVFLKENSLL